MGQPRKWKACECEQNINCQWEEQAGKYKEVKGMKSAEKMVKKWRKAENTVCCIE